MGGKGVLMVDGVLRWSLMSNEKFRKYIFVEES